MLSHSEMCEILELANTKDIEGLKKFKEKINLRYYDQTPLTKALGCIEYNRQAGTKNADIVSTLLEAQADPNVKIDEDENTALHHVVTNYNSIDNDDLLEVLSLLIQHKAYLEARNVDGLTPLNSCLRNASRQKLTITPNPKYRKEKLEICYLLVKANANVQTTDEHGDTPLHRAAEHGLNELIELFIKKGALVNAKNKDGQTPLSYAVRAGQVDSARCLVSHKADLSIIDSTGDSLLHRSLLQDSVETTVFLLEQNADIERCTSNEKSPITPLISALIGNQEKMVAALIAFKADINRKDSSDLSPLNWAVLSGCIGIIPILIALGADPKSKPKSFSKILKAVTKLDESQVQATKAQHFLSIFHHLAPFFNQENIQSLVDLIEQTYRNAMSEKFRKDLLDNHHYLRDIDNKVLGEVIKKVVDDHCEIIFKDYHKNLKAATKTFSKLSNTQDLVKNSLISCLDNAFFIRKIQRLYPDQCIEIGKEKSIVLELDKGERKICSDTPARHKQIPTSDSARKPVTSATPLLHAHRVKTSELLLQSHGSEELSSSTQSISRIRSAKPVSRSS